MKPNSKTSIYNQIAMILEAYTQLDDYMRNAESEDKKLSNKQLSDRGNALQVFGQTLYNKLESRGSMDTYAPITIESLRLEYKDFAAIIDKWIVGDELIDKYVQKIIKKIQEEYPTGIFKLTLGGIINSNINCRTFDDVCRFFSVFYKAVTKTVKGIEPYMNWKPVITKLKRQI